MICRMVLINFYQNRFPFSPTRCILSLPITYVRMKLICEHQQFRGHVTCKIPKTDLNTQCYTFDFGCCVFKWMEKMSIPWWMTIIVPPEYFLNSNRGLLSLIHPLNFSFIRVYPLQFHAEMLLISRFSSASKLHLHTWFSLSNSFFDVCKLTFSLSSIIVYFGLHVYINIPQLFLTYIYLLEHKLITFFLNKTWYMQLPQKSINILFRYEINPLL